MDKNQAIEYINLDLENYPQIKNACLKVIDLICNSKNRSTLKHIAFYKLGNAIDTKEKKIILDVTRYLSGDRLNLLNICFELIEDDNPTELETRYVKEAIQSGEFYHPETGELIEDFESKLYMYFSLSETGKNMTC